VGVVENGILTQANRRGAETDNGRIDSLVLSTVSITRGRNAYDAGWE
jgi:hypothetical protein